MAGGTDPDADVELTGIGLAEQVPSAPAHVDLAPMDDEHRSRSWTDELARLAVIAVVLTLVVRLLVVQVFFIPTGSMESTLDPGDRVLVSGLPYRFGQVHRGDVIVFDGRGSFSPADAPTGGHSTVTRALRVLGSFVGVVPSDRDFVKRVIGLPGDHVVCCDKDGLLTVNGRALDEPYLFSGDVPSQQGFDVVVPAGRLWVMGDHRSRSGDSRAHLGDPGGGTVPLDRVVGKVLVRFWPLDRAGGSEEMGRRP